MSNLEPIVICPKCKKDFKLTESLAAPLLESAKKNFEKMLAQKDADILTRAASLEEREKALAKAKSAVADEVATKLKAERSKIEVEEKKKARQVLGADLEQRNKEIADLNEIIKSRESKLAEAQNAQVDLLKKQRELEDAKREIGLTIQKGIHEGLEKTREVARKEAEEALNLRLSEKEQMIVSMKKQIEEMKRRVEQGSQQLQGEVQEIVLETLLRSKFPLDAIESIAKGEFGGDVLQRVISPSGQICGNILWESKRTKAWNDAWLPKLRDDQRTAKADVALLVTQALPKGIESFSLVDGVWVAHYRVALAVALPLREMLVQVNTARQVSSGQQTKTEMIYQYLTGPRFKQRIEAIVEAFTTMKVDLETERKIYLKQWAKREQQIERVMQGTVGMYGDLEGIAGKSIQQVEGLEMKKLLENSPDQDEAHS